MLTKTIKYKDFDGEESSDTLYFNISRVELSENLDLRDELLALVPIFEADQREMTPNEVKQLLNLIKRIIKLAYGVKDGKKFSKSEEIWEDFKSTATHDEFVWSLFNPPQNAVDFLLNVMPQDLRIEAEAAAKTQHPELFDNNGNLTELDNKPLWMQEGRKPTPAEIQRMSKEEIARAMEYQQSLR